MTCRSLTPFFFGFFFAKIYNIFVTKILFFAASHCDPVAQFTIVVVLAESVKRFQQNTSKSTEPLDMCMYGVVVERSLASL